jgi:hypothetical protein
VGSAKRVVGVDEAAHGAGGVGGASRGAGVGDRATRGAGMVDGATRGAGVVDRATRGAGIGASRGIEAAQGVGNGARRGAWEEGGPDRTRGGSRGRWVGRGQQGETHPRRIRRDKR